MPKEDKPNIVTPADQRRKQRSAVFVFGVFLVVILAGLAATVLLVNDGRNYKRLVRKFGLEEYLLPAPPPPDLRVDRQRQLQPADRYPPWLLRTRLERSALFEKNTFLSPEERCDKVGAERDAAPEFTSANDDWECLFFESFGTATEPASLFVQARGSLPDVLQSFRIKLSFTDPLVERAVADETMAIIDRFGIAITRETRDYLANKISRREDFTSVLENYRLTFSREMMDDRRHNLLVLPRPPKVACGEPAPPSPDKNLRPIYRMPIGCLVSNGPPKPLPAS
ncbi:DUF6030 family protein [Neorhizobium alkalisoli]|uniref:DUF6030 family protein n=1 Tax=Neorhizobium alkalisoli TaxID=528178 RepID=UPI000CF92707|nr:DUF6030 family protein [Neorhizobium alkalisoli]